MDITFWYSISISALAAVLLLCTVGRYFAKFFLKLVEFAFFRYVWYALLVRRRYWGSVTRGQGALLMIFVVVNGFCMGLGIHTTDDLIKRTGLLASINIIPLFFGGRTSILADLLGISLHSYYLAHHWIGRVVVLQSLLHTSLVMARGDAWTFNVLQVSGISAASAMALLILTSLYFIRRAAYEIFLKIHFVLGVVSIVALFSHLAPKGFQRLAYPTAAVTVWFINFIVRLIRIVYLSSGSRDFQSQATIQPFLHSDPHKHSAVLLTILLRRPLKLLPGQYFYVFFSDLGLRRRFQAHPFVACWWDSLETANSLSFLVQPQKGLSKGLTSRSSLRRIILDGPYGKELKLQDYETVILIAKGIGIAGVLPHALSLVERKNHVDKVCRQSIRTRKVNLIWILEENLQIEWVSSWIQELQAKDPQRLILSMLCYFPSKPVTKIPFDDPYYRTFFGEQPKIEESIEMEVMQTPGRALVAVCGDGPFSTHIRKLVLNVMIPTRDISFTEVDFHPQRNPVRNWSENLAPFTVNPGLGDPDPGLAKPPRALKPRLERIDEGVELEDLEPTDVLPKAKKLIKLESLKSR